MIKMIRKIDPYFEHLQRFPLSYSYEESKECLISFIDDAYDPEDTTPYHDVIVWIIKGGFMDEMNQNGMDKAVNNIVIGLCLIEHNDLDAILLYESYCDMLDLETGEYDDLFNEEDLRLLKADMVILKDFFEKRPEFADPDYLPDENA